MKSLLLGAIALFGASAFGQTVWSVASTPGDSITANGATGSAGWFYNDVLAGATAGINTSIARNGNASMVYRFDGTTTAKADILNVKLSGSSLVPLGALSNLTQWSYESYRDASSTATFHPSARLVIASVAQSFNQIVFDSSFTSSQWELNTITDSSNVWLSRTITIGATSYGGASGSNLYSQAAPSSFGALKALLNGNSATSIMGFNIGAGSGISQPWIGASDTLTYQFGTGPVQSFNFEAVPEPASMAALGMGALALLRKRKKS